MKYYDIYITFAFFVKIIFIILALSLIVLKIKGDDEKSKLEITIKYWKERVEFIFTITMALLLIYLFSPRVNRTTLIDRETKILFYLFGFILIITAKWEDFIRESKWVYFLQKIVGQVGSR